VFWEAFRRLQFGFVIFCQKEIGTWSEILMKLTQFHQNFMISFCADIILPKICIAKL
jgi:hypothetical protein